MAVEFDHLAVSAATLAQGVEYVEDLLQVTLAKGGEHPQMGTHNRLLSLGPSVYLEVIAINPEAADPDRARWFDLDRFSGDPRITNWIVQCDDLDAAIALSPAGIGEVMALKRADLRWRMAVPLDGQLPFDGGYPALIAWDGAAHPAARLPDQGCRLLDFNIYHPDSNGLRRALKPVFDGDTVSIIAADTVRFEAQIQTKTGMRLLR